MGHFIETKTNETHSLNKLYYQQISAGIEKETITNNSLRYDFPQPFKTYNYC